MHPYCDLQNKSPANQDNAALAYLLEQAASMVKAGNISAFAIVGVDQQDQLTCQRVISDTKSQEILEGGIITLLDKLSIQKDTRRRVA